MTAAGARAFWITEPGRGEVRAETLRSPGLDEVVVRALYSGVSRGTEALVFQGRVPISEHHRMRAPFQEGQFPAPVKYGYASVGEVERGPQELEGRRVFVLYPHQTRYCVPAAAVHVLPESLPPGRAVLAANLETAVNGIWDAGVQPGDRVAVIGAGTVGCLLAWLAGRIPGCRVQLVDINPSRAAAARALGVSFVEPAVVSSDIDVVIHASGSSSGLALALKIAGFESTVVEMSWYGTNEVAIPLGEAFHAKRLTLKSSQVGHIAASQRSRWDTRRRMRFALELLADPALDALITSESDLESLPDVMAQLASSPGDTICHRVKYV
jgi:NADPH:quinone reductase-like Zn-dependent oxidoreductase